MNTDEHGFLNLAIAAVALASLSPVRLERFEAVEPCMGTLFRVVLYAENAERAQRAFRAAFDRAQALDTMLSDYRPDSELSRLSRSRRARVSPDLVAVLTVARSVAQETGGAFDPTIGPVVRLWREVRRSHRLPTQAEIDSVLGSVGWRMIHIDDSVVELRAADPLLDLGGIAKGYAADQMLLVLRDMGLPHALVAASGDLALGEPPPGETGWRVSLGASGEIELLARCGVSTSGDNEQYVVIDGVRYSHVIDPRTGWARRDSTSVTVIARNATRADALATAFSVDPDIRLRKDGRVRVIYGNERAAVDPLH
jgi:thiamine biosynthesis lipoprotein